jgi:hypothetical protein
LTAPTVQLHIAEEVVTIAHKLGARHVTLNSVKVASYEGKRPLKRIKIAGRVYYRRSDIDKWLAGEPDPKDAA